MLKIATICLLLLPLTALGQTNDTAERSAIRDVVDRFMDAWNRHDAKDFAQVFAEDADFTNVFGVSVSGRSKIEEFHKTIFEAIFRNSHLNYTDIKIRFVRPEVAGVDVHWHMTGVLDSSGGARPDREGLLNFVMVRDAGRWQIVVMHNLELTAAPQPPK